MNMETAGIHFLLKWCFAHIVVIIVFAYKLHNIYEKGLNHFDQIFS